MDVFQGVEDFDHLEAIIRGERNASGTVLGPDGQPARGEDPEAAERRRLALLGCLDTPESTRLAPDIPRSFLIDPIVPTGKVTLVVGDSGIGKTPLLYQMGISLAAGRPFLNMPVKPVPVLYIDAESSQEHSVGYQKQMRRFLGLGAAEQVPFHAHGMWHDKHWPDKAKSSLLQHLDSHVLELAALIKPQLVVFDCIRVLWPEAEKDAVAVKKMWELHYKLQELYGAATMVVHHLRKAPVDSKTGRGARVKLQDDPREWLHNTAGTGALINTCESRLGVALYKGLVDREKTILMRGFSKGEGATDKIVAERVPDPEHPHGKPYGYKVNVEALQEELRDEYRQLLDILPAQGVFKNRDAVRLGESIDVKETMVNDALKALVKAQLVAKVPQGYSVVRKA